MIEISVREGVLDEYAVPVPSPAYCDYRLPGYEDIMAGNGVARAATSLSGPSAGATVTTAGTESTQPRYMGLPPAYESDSEDDSDRGADEEDEEEGEDDNDSDSDSDGHRGSRENGVSSGSTEPRTTTPMEMTAVVTVSSPVGPRVGTRTGVAESITEQEEDGDPSAGSVGGILPNAFGGKGEGTTSSSPSKEQ
ncbi:hypothetical protein BC939DRAFT_460177 [Gamsiella multidivaricata]|uniref:uncharacterized protein n=1 Tax=Gamsiella multidivaricata TaxID=101098 RepID=UPI00221ED29B|nr:uncharacterized protein BC939DRAFT_460177 [Gamsiella multidivaricata]KAI7819414.1 hypothetical protein BC939DRAFT_460177 [Gamsiella multidivaricata]